MIIYWIEPGKLAAGQIPADADMVRSLHSQGIRAIISLTESPLTAQQTITRQLIADLDINCLHVPIPDWQPPDPDTAETVVRFIDQMAADGRPAYLHCHAGIGRTGTLLHYYYLSHGLSLSQAQAKVVASKPSCNFTALSGPQRAFLTRVASLNG